MWTMFIKLPCLDILCDIYFNKNCYKNKTVVKFEKFNCIYNNIWIYYIYQHVQYLSK